MFKVIITMKFHLFEVVTFEILDFEGHKYEKVDHLGQLCPSCPPVHILE